MPKSYLLELIRQVLSEKDSPVSALLLSCKRIATIRADVENLWWIEYELHDGDVLKDIANQFMWSFDKKKFAKLETLYTKIWTDERQINQYEVSNGKLIIKDNTLAFSVGGIESRKHSLAIKIASLSKASDDKIPETNHTENNDAQVRNVLNSSIEEIDCILNRIKTRAIDYLIANEVELMRGNSLSRYYESNKKFVSSTLSSIDEQFKDELNNIDLHLYSGSANNLSEALWNIRKVLCHYANVVCPISDETIDADGRKRKAKSSVCLNHIISALYQKVDKQTSIELLDIGVTELWNKVEKLNALGIKGVRTKVTEDEAFQCVSQLYVLLGQMIRIFN